MRLSSTESHRLWSNVRVPVNTRVGTLWMRCRLVVLLGIALWTAKLVLHLGVRRWLKLISTHTRLLSMCECLWHVVINPALRLLIRRHLILHELLLLKLHVLLGWRLLHRLALRVELHTHVWIALWTHMWIALVRVVLLVIVRLVVHVSYMSRFIIIF